MDSLKCHICFYPTKKQQKASPLWCTYVIRNNTQGPDSIWRCRLTSIGNPIVEIRRSYDRLISTMGFPIPVRRHLYIESGPWSISLKVFPSQCKCKWKCFLMSFHSWPKFFFFWTYTMQQCMCYTQSIVATSMLKSERELKEIFIS